MKTSKAVVFASMVLCLPGCQKEKLPRVKEVSVCTERYIGKTAHGRQGD